MITLIGSEGSMGKRYQAMLKYYGAKYKCFDKEHSFETIKQSAEVSSGVIIASPTSTHAEYLRQLLPAKVPILCEKPIMKDMDELNDLISFCHRHDYRFNMMMQYKELVDDSHVGPSEYNYFRTGPDGLIWDCLQIIALAKNSVILGNESPIWNCTINGKPLDISDMDYAYLKQTLAWLNGNLHQRLDDLLKYHIKTAEMAGTY